MIIRHCLSIFLLFPIISQADKIILVADQWCPYNCESSSDKPGFMVEIASTIFSQAGHHIEYKVVPWKRALQGVQRGIYQGAIAATPENSKFIQPNLIFPREEQGRMHNVFFTLKSSVWRYQGPNTLDGQKVGLVGGYAFPEISSYAIAHPKKVDLQYTTGELAVQENIRKLFFRRVSTVLEDESVFIYNANALGMLDAFHIAGEEGSSTSSNNLYIGFTPFSKNPKSIEYARILSDGMQQLRKSGRLAQIMARYGLKDWR